MTLPQDPFRRARDRDHRRHDLDLIASYAGDDPGIDRDSAAALVASCPECRSEFDLQRRVAAWTSAAPLVTMNEAERSLLHDRIDGAINQPNVVSIDRHRSKRQPGQLLLRIGTAAAALAVVAGLGGLFTEIGGDDDGGTAFQTIASELAAGSDETTAAAAATTTAASFAAASAERSVLPGGDADAVREEIEELMARAAAPEEAGVPADAQADAMNGIPPCIDELSGREVLITAESVLDGEPIVVFVVSTTEESEPAASGADVEALVFRTVDCSTVDLG